MFRSLLFIPGNNPSMLQNADVFVTDAVVFDLEDAVSNKEKNNARNLVKNYLETSSVLPKQIILRINAIDSVWFKEDLKLLKTKKINYLLIPKTNKKTMEEITIALSAFEKKNDLEETKIIALVETAQGINEIEKFTENIRLSALLLGAEDLANDLEIKRTETNDEIHYARSKVIFSAASHGLIAIDTPYTDINNLEGLRKDAEQAKMLGMKAKAAIHPNHIEIINEVFSPTKDEILWATEIIKLSQESDSIGTFQYKGKMIDKPIIERANKILFKANKFGLM